MHANALHDLLRPGGQEALRTAMELSPRESDFLAHFQVLCRLYPAGLARAALEVAILRGEAAAKFPFAEVLYFTREALEQASSWEVSSYRAGRFAGCERLLDLGCSAGGDTLALASLATTTGVDNDPLRLALARENLKSRGLGARASFVQADLNAPLPFASLAGKLHPAHSTGLFFDPARRTASRRIHSVRAYRPPLAVVRSWLSRFPALGVKVSPGVDLEELGEFDAEVEFISLRGELKEAALWFGPLKSASRRATILPGAHTLVSGGAAECELRDPGEYIYEPDPAVLRAGLVRDLAERLGAAQLDADIAYLTADRQIATPFARGWQVENWFPFGLKRLRAYLRQRGVGRVTVKKRGSPLQPEKLIRDLRLQGEAERVVFLTHLRGKPIAIIALTG